MEMKNYYLGLDIGTDSVGYAVTDKEYRLKRFHGSDAWGVHLFDVPQLNTERRAFRTAKRRLDRRQQRAALVREFFAPQISKIDERFFIRLDESALFREDAAEPYAVFNDKGFTDAEYYHRYPTIHHLIAELMESDEPHDVRLVYLACAWLVTHRGHFLSEVSVDNIAALTDFSSVYDEFAEYFPQNEYAVPWGTVDTELLKEILPKKISLREKNKLVVSAFFGDGKAPKDATDEFPFNCEVLLKLLCGSKIKPSELFCREGYEELESFSLGSDDETLAALFANLGDDADLLIRMKAVFDWAVLVDIVPEKSSLSAAKVGIYEQHKRDLETLKAFVRKYLPEKYAEVFRENNAEGYAAYSGHTGGIKGLKKANKETFCAYLAKLLKNVEPEEADAEAFKDMKNRIDLRTFLPKQKDTDNRVIPYQIYLYELRELLKKAEGYLPFLAEKDADGLTVSEKLLSVFSFRVPYFVGPLNAKSAHAWICRKAEGKIYPWNIDALVDYDATEQAFIQRMTNYCTYLPDKKVLPKESLLYHKYAVLNEINNIRVDNVPITPEDKQSIFNGLFCVYRKVTRRKLEDFMLANGIMSKGQTLSGVDININANLGSYHDFKRLLTNGVLTEQDVEKIIERRTYTEDKTRFVKWLAENFGSLSDADIKYISRLNYKDFGRLSAEFLTGFEGVDNATGEVMTIMSALWNTNNNLMELLSDKFTFRANIEKYTAEYYAGNRKSLSERLDEMYLSNAVKRPVIRTLDIVSDVCKAFGGAPEKIFIEMTRGASEEQRNKRTKTRKQQILELYAQCRDEDVRELKKELEALGELADNKLRGDKLFLYFMQLGKSIYSGKPIDLDQLGTKVYDIDHIYPQKLVKDDSIINNRVLCLSEENGFKTDRYPVPAEWRSAQKQWWEHLKSVGLLSEEKYYRLTRHTPFTEEEKFGFINRQLTETSQATKAVAELLKERCPDTRIVYVKARLTSEFRQEYDMLKSRTVNDLHHAKDAYLNIVTGNVYDERFSKRWFDINKEYSLNTKTIFNRELICGGELIWAGEKMIPEIRKTVAKNSPHVTKYAFCKQGGFFDQMPVAAAPGLVPRKANLPTEKYGGYNKPSIAFFSPVRYTVGKKSDIMIMSVELLRKNEFLAGGESAERYAKEHIGKILGKKVDSVSFPMGLKILKINTVFSLDGFRITLAGGAGGGTKIIAAPFMMFAADAKTERYIKRLEMLCEKTKNNPKYIFDTEFDKVTREENTALYDRYIEKLSGSIFAKRVNNPVETLKTGRGKFIAISETEQAAALLNIHQVFGRISGGIDLTAIGGVKKAAATVSFSSNMSNWKKNYKDVRIVDQTASGLWEKQSDNLFSLL